MMVQTVIFAIKIKLPLAIYQICDDFRLWIIKQCVRIHDYSPFPGQNASIIMLTGIFRLRDYVVMVQIHLGKGLFYNFNCLAIYRGFS